MKRILLAMCACAIVFSGFAQSEIGTAVRDKFTDTVTSPSNFQQGVYWFSNDSLQYPDPSLNRDGSGTMTADCDSCGVAGPEGFENLFGVNFGDSNGEDPGGDPNWIDLSKNADVSLTVENTSDTLLILTFAMEDTNGIQATIQPDTSATSSWGDVENRVSKPGLVLPPNTERSVTFKMETDQGNNRAGNTVDTTVKTDDAGNSVDPGYPCDSPQDCPTTNYVIDPSAISQVVFFVNGGAEVTGDQGGGSIWDPSAPSSIGNLTNFTYLSQDNDVVYDAPGNPEYQGKILFKNFELGDVSPVDFTLSTSGQDTTVTANWANASADSAALLMKGSWQAESAFDTVSHSLPVTLDTLQYDSTYDFKVVSYGATQLPRWNESRVKSITAGQEQTAVYSNFNAPELVVYPNPANNVINVEGINGDIALTLTNQVGKQVASGSGNQLDVSNLNSGIYFLTVKNNGEIVDRRKVLVE